MGFLFGGKKTNRTVSNEEPKINTLRVQTSNYGQVLPVVFGCNRVSGNIIDYVDFKAHAHTEEETTVTGGGKGGGNVQSTTTVNKWYTYTVQVAISLCEGVVNHIGKTWKNKEVTTFSNLDFSLFSGSQSSAWSYMTSKHPSRALVYKNTAYVAGEVDLGKNAELPQYNFEVFGLNQFKSPEQQTKKNYHTAVETFTVTEASRIYTVNNAAAFENNINVYVQDSEELTISSDRYSCSLGKYNFKLSNEYLYTSKGILITYMYLNTSTGLPEMTTEGFTIDMNNRSFTVSHNTTFISNISVTLVNTKTTKKLAFPLWYTETSGVYNFVNDYFINKTVEIHYKYYSTYTELLYIAGDANPKDILTTLLTNDTFGLGLSSNYIDDLTNYSNYCLANNILLSPVLTEETEAYELLTDMLLLTNSQAIFSEGKFKLIPYGDETITGNDVTYTPDMSPLYDLDNDDFLDDNLTCLRVNDNESYNSVKIEYVNRSNDYNIEVVELKDSASIEDIGLREHDTIKLHAITSASLASKIAELFLRKKLYVRNKYQFRLGWKYALLECMDLITITDESLGLDRLLVRVEEIEEDEQGTLTIIAEECLIGVASPAIYDDQATEPTVIDYNIDPGYCNDPVFYEPPFNLTQANMFELWIASSGINSSWGGCNIWISIDGDEYKKVGRLDAPSKTGYLLSSLPIGFNPDLVNTLSVDLSESSGTLESVSQSDFDKYVTLCAIGEEVLAYKTATLTDTNKYDLTTLHRGIFNTPISAHSENDRFIRLNVSSIYRHMFTYDDLGKSISIKLTSFNVYGGAEQTLDQVFEYTYQLKCNALKYDYPNDVTGLLISLDPNDKTKITLEWNEVNNIDLAGYEIRKGGSEWLYSSYVDTVKGNKLVLATKENETATYRIKAVDIYGNYSVNDDSTDVTIVLNPDDVSGFTISQSVEDKTKLNMKWNANNESDIAYYEIRQGSSWNAGTLVTRTKTTSYLYTLTSEGSKTFWIKAYNNNNQSSINAISNTASYNYIPATPANLAVLQVITDRSKVKISWNANNESDIAYYEIREGASWDTGSIIATLLKATNYEYQLPSEGSKTFWVKAVSNAGVYSTDGVYISQSFSIKPSIPTDLEVSQDEYNKTIASISWTAVNQKDIAGYEVRLGSVWSTATIIGTTKETSIKTTITETGNYTFLIKAITVSNYYSDAANITAFFNVLISDVTNFDANQFSSDKSLVRLTWNSVSDKDISYYEIREGVDWDTGSIVATRLTTLFFDTTISEERVYNYWIKAFSIAGIESQYPAYTGSIFNMNPSAPANLAYSQSTTNKNKLNITWDKINDLDILEYELRQGISWDTANIITRTRETSLEWTIPASNTYKFILKAKNTSGFYSDEIAITVDLSIEPSDVTNFQALQNGSNVLFLFDAVNDPDISFYEIREGYTWDNSSVVITGLSQNYYSIGVDTETTKKYMIKAVNTSGKYSVNSAYDSVTILDLPPKNVIYSYDELSLQSGSYNNTVFGISTYNCSNFGGQCDDYTTLRCNEVGGATVLKLALNGSVYHSSGSYTVVQKDVGKVITANITTTFIKSSLFSAGVDAVLQFRTSTNGTTYTNWKNFLPGLNTFRYLQMKVLLSTQDTSKTPEVSSFTIYIDVPDTIETGDGVSVPVGGKAITFNSEYWQIPGVYPVVVYNGGAGVTAQLYNKSVTGFSVKVLNSSGSDVGGVINWLSKGF